jgi:hypothetical protein
VRLRALQAEGPVVVEESGRAFLCGVGAGALRFEPPALQPPRAGESLATYLERLDAGPRRQLLVLVQAGATALGLWAGEVLIAHKVIKKYVVRGHGKAQPAHLKTRGKSRYGSRLRLRNAEAQLVQTNEKILAWWGTHGPADDVFLSCPTRTVPELFAVRPPPPFPREAVHRIRLDVHVPDFAELKDVHRRMARGRLGPAQRPG